MIQYLIEKIGLVQRPFNRDNFLAVKKSEQLNRLNPKQKEAFFEAAMNAKDHVVTERGLHFYHEEPWFQALFIEHHAAMILLHNTTKNYGDIIQPTEFFLKHLLTYPEEHSYNTLCIQQYCIKHVRAIFDFHLESYLTRENILKLSYEDNAFFEHFCEKGLIDKQLEQDYVRILRNFSRSNTQTQYFYNKPYASFGVQQKVYPLTGTEILSFQEEIYQFFHNIAELDTQEKQYWTTRATSFNTPLEFLRKNTFSMKNMFDWLSVMDIHTQFTSWTPEFLFNFEFLFTKIKPFTLCSLELSFKIEAFQYTNTHAMALLIKNLTLDFYINNILETDIHGILCERYPEFVKLHFMEDLVDKNTRVFELIDFCEHSIEETELHI